MTTITLPEKPRGRPPQSYYEKLKVFSDQLQKIQSRIGFKMSARGWCYFLENKGLLRKGRFDYVEGLINKCRKKDNDQYLPLDFTAQDEKREFHCKERVETFEQSPAEYLASQLEDVVDSARYYDVGFWQYQDYYIQCLVEKIDLVELFKPISRKYHIPIANMGGWYSILVRGILIDRFKQAEQAGKTPVLLLCTDFDPYGVDQIAKKLRKNLDDLQEATGWTTQNLVIDRFGLNYDFIETHDLPWINNLETSSGRDLASPSHQDYSKPFVQDWLDRYGPRKVEANALIGEIEKGRTLYQDAVKKYLGDSPLEAYQEQVRDDRAEIRDLLEDVNPRTIDAKTLKTLLNQASQQLRKREENGE